MCLLMMKHSVHMNSVKRVGCNISKPRSRAGSGYSSQRYGHNTNEKYETYLQLVGMLMRLTVKQRAPQQRP